jgi:predicted nucleic acid-binding protein
MYLLDNNAVINYLDGSMPTSAMLSMNNIVDIESNISVITKIETLGFAFKTMADQITTESFVNGSTILHLDDDIVNFTINIRKTNKIKTPDAIIAATALVYNLTLISRNLSDFKNILGLQVIDPFTL